MQDVYNNYEEPITLMRKLSEISVPFSFSHKRSDGTTCIVIKASLRPQSSTLKDRNAKYKLQYTNLNNGEQRSCFIPSLLSVNDKLIKIS